MQSGGCRCDAFRDGAIGGAYDSGVVFSVPTSGGTPKVLHHFDRLHGRNPTGNLVLRGSTLYGTTLLGGEDDGGTVFQINLDGSGYKVVWDFDWAGGGRPCGLLLSGSTLYGTANQGGKFGYGTVYAIDLNSGLGPKTVPEKQTMNSIGMKLTLIPAGEFMMGSRESEKETAAFFNKNYDMGFLTAGSFANEHPLHRAPIDRRFYLGTYHVTRGQFRQFVKETGYKTDAEKGVESRFPEIVPRQFGAYGWGGDKKQIRFGKEYAWQNPGFEQTDEHPVVCVSWNDAVAFCEWLSRKERKLYRLPNEGQWEYACRAGTTTRYSFGDDPEGLATAGNVANATLKAKFPDWKRTIHASDGYVFTAPVGQFKPNPWGLYDMYGNAWQWCAEWSGEDFILPPNVSPDRPFVRVVRGGSWANGPNDARSACRGVVYANRPNCRTGFRVVRSP